MALAPTHVGTITPLQFGADLGGSCSWIALELPATQVSNARAGCQLRRCAALALHTLVLRLFYVRPWTRHVN